MDSTKYIGMDVHKETVSIAVMNSAGMVVTESIIETRQRSNALTLLPRINVDPPVQRKWRRIFFFQVAFRFEKGLGDLFGGKWQRDLRMGSEHFIPIV